MMKVIYSGTSDFQGFGPEDFAKANIEVEEEFVFPQGRAVEVPDEVGVALVHEEGIFGDFRFEAYEDLTEEQQRIADGLGEEEELETNFPGQNLKLVAVPADEGNSESKADDDSADDSGGVEEPKDAVDEDDEDLSDEAEGDPVKDEQLPKSGKAATTEGTASPAAGGTTGPTSTGRGSSTGGTTTKAPRGGRGRTTGGAS